VKAVGTGHRGSVRKRTGWLFIIFILLYVALGARLAYIQLVRADEYKGWAHQIRFRPIVDPASRGCIYDRDKRVLALSIETASIFANRKELRRIPETADMVARILGADRQVILDKLNGPGSKIWLAKKVDPRIGKEIEKAFITTLVKQPGHKPKKQRELLASFGIGVEWDTKRVYPAGPLAAQLLGFVDFKNKGVSGIESMMNDELTGQPGFTTAELDGRRRIIPETQQTIREPEDGKDIVLTIHTGIQHIAEQALANMAQKFHPASAVAVVLDANTSEVLAMANYPAFDPNKPGGSDAKLWRNRAVADLYEPGSTLKTVTVSAAMNEGIDPHEVVANCTGREQIKGGHISCTLHAPYLHGHQGVDMYKIIQYSCNIGAAHLAFKIGAEKLYKYERAFGLMDEKVSGRQIPPQDWSQMRLANIGFGQGIHVTALQMAAVYATIANGGKYTPPTIIREIRNADGSVYQPFKTSAPKRVVSPATAAEVKKMLMVCANEGTGKPALIEGRTVAGKTGSAQMAKPKGGYEPGAFVASFMGFAPALKPRIVIAVSVTKPQGSHWGATVAAPVFKEIGEKTLLLPDMRVPADAPIEPKSVPKSGAPKVAA